MEAAVNFACEYDLELLSVKVTLRSNALCPIDAVKTLKIRIVEKNVQHEKFRIYPRLFEGDLGVNYGHDRQGQIQVNFFTETY